MWTALRLSGFEQSFDSIACYQMSGLFARDKVAGRDGVRYTRSKHIGDIWVPVQPSEVRMRRSIDHPIYSFLQV
jgi:hypothetical protein